MSHLHASQEHHLPVHRCLRFLFRFNNLIGQSLDVFDPFDENDMACKNPTTLTFLSDPPRLPRDLCPVTGHMTRHYTAKFRVTLDVSGDLLKHLTVDVTGLKLQIDVKEEDHDGDSFSKREIRKTYDLPDNARVEYTTSFLTSKGVLVVDFPLVTEAKERDDHHRQVERFGGEASEFNFDEFFKSSFEPKISDGTEHGCKKIDMSLDMTGFGPDQIQVHLKDYDLIVQAQSSSSDKYLPTRSYIYKAITLPPDTDLELMRSFLHDDKRLVITVPFNKQKPVTSNKDEGNIGYVETGSNKSLDPTQGVVERTTEDTTVSSSEPLPGPNIPTSAR